MSYLEPPEYELRGPRHRPRHEQLAASDEYDGFDRYQPAEYESRSFTDELDLGLGLDTRRSRHLEPAPEPVPPPAEVAPPAPEPAPSPNGRAGRNLPAAIAVGTTLGVIVVLPLVLWRPAFLFVVVAAMGLGVWEMVRAVSRDDGARPPLVPLLAGTVAMTVLAWFAGPEAVTLALVLTVLATMVWRLADGPYRYQRDLLTAILIAVYVPFLGSFAVLLDRPSDGAARVIVMLAAVVLSDTGGYVAGVFFGRHAMAPTVSPKKSWEGAVGSLVCAATGGALMLFFLFHVPWWHGALFGLGVAAASVLGDLAESLLKRDLKVKDMSHLLPGHGGLMDRLDSVLFAVPTAFMLFSVLAPAAT
jgi:phosphatidate cytidylyltransferase